MEFLFKKPNLIFLIAIRFQTAKELPTGNYVRDYSLFRKIANLNHRIGAIYEKCKRAVSEVVVCTSESWMSYEKHDLALYPGDTVYFLNGRVHAENKPAIIYNPAHDGKRYFNLPTGAAPQRDVYLWRNGVEYWQNNKLHRLDGPARKFKGGEEWFKEGKLHRIGGPALILNEGNLVAMWWYEGVIHCETGPAIIYRDGKQMWFIHNKKHRIDGPAVIYPNGDYEYYVNGFLHRYEDYAVKRLGTTECHICGEKVNFHQDADGKFLGYVNEVYVAELLNTKSHLLEIGLKDTKDTKKMIRVFA